ncbi:MAG: SPFH domain-containing protein [Candidatus Diapherotrites archaeon]|nr:SPFH domain-containing protein [Candidatus Diapherotrites archaeon]
MKVEEKKEIVFFAIILAFAFLIFIFFYFQDTITRNILWLVLLVVFLALIIRYDFLLTLQEYERVVIFRFGRVNRVSGPGWCFVFPPFETYRLVDLRVITLDVPKQDVITKDKVELKIDAVVYLKVKKDKQSIINSVVEVKDYKEATILYVIARVRDIIGSMTFDEVISNVNHINQELKKGIEEISKEWGITCEAVELKDVDVPDVVMDAMHKSKAAFHEKKARQEQAEAHMAEIEAVRQAAEKLSDKALAYYYIKALEELGKGKSTKFVFPMEISALVSSISSKLSTKQDSKEIEELFRYYEPKLKEVLDKLEEKEKADKKDKRKKK